MTNLRWLLPGQWGRAARVDRLLERGRRRKQLGDASGALADWTAAEKKARAIASHDRRETPIGAVLLELGTLHQEAGRLDAAARCFEEVVKHRPLPDSALRCLGAGLAARGDVSPKAIDVYLKCLRLRPRGSGADAVHGLLQRLCAWAEGASDETAAAAVRIARQVREADDSLPWAHAAVGREAFALGKHRDALRSLGRARELGSRDPWVEGTYHRALAELELRKGEWRAAVAALDRASAAEPGRPAPLLKGGKLRVAAADEWPRLEDSPLPEEHRTLLEEAVDRLGRGLALGFDAEASYYRGAALLRLGRTEEARQDLAAALQGSGAAGAHWEYAAELYGAIALWRAGRPSEGLAAALRAAKSCGWEDEEVLRVLGRVAEAASAFEWALRAWSTLSECHPEDAEVAEGRGRALFALTRYPEAREALRPAVEAGRAPAAVLAGRALLRSGMPAEGAPELAEACRRHPDSADAAHYHGCALAALGRHAEAEAELTRALDLGAPAARRERGRVRALLGRLAPARADYEEALRADARDRRARAGLAWVLALSGETAEAVRILEPDDRSAEPELIASWLRGLIHEREGRLEAAANAYEETLQQLRLEAGEIPALDVLNRKIIVMGRAHRHAQVLAAMVQVRKEWGPHALRRLAPDALACGAVSADHEGRPELALTWLEELATRQPRDAALRDFLLKSLDRVSASLLAAGDEEPALRARQRCAELAPEDAAWGQRLFETRLHLAAQALRGRPVDHTAAAAHLRHARELRPEDPRARILAGIALLLEGKLEPARLELAGAVPGEDRWLAAACAGHLAIADLAAGDSRGALERVAALNGDLEGFGLRLALVAHAQRGVWDSAAECARRVLAAEAAPDPGRA